MQRILILGCPGSGKSTLAQQVANITLLPLIHLDQYYWLPNWIEPNSETWQHKVLELANTQQWVMDGNYGNCLFNYRLQRADAVVFLKLPRLLCLWRVVKRILGNYGHIRPDMAKNCPERFDWAFLQYVWQYKTRREPHYLQTIHLIGTQQNQKLNNSNKHIFILTNKQKIANFLNEISLLYR